MQWQTVVASRIKSMIRHITKAMAAANTPKWAEGIFDTADTMTQLADVEPTQHERLDSSSDNSEVDEPKAETMTQEVDEPKADTLARAPEMTFTKWDTYLFGFNSEAQKGWRLKDRNSKKEWCSTHVVPDNDDEFITGVWPDECVKNLTVTAGEFRALQTRAAEKAGKTAKPNGPLWLREKEGITAQLSKKWDPKSGTVLLLHYKPKDFQGKNPLGSQIAQFVVHEKDKEESLAKTYMDAARKGMVEIGERIINGQLAPEKANEEKKKIDHPTNWGVKRKLDTSAASEPASKKPAAAIPEHESDNSDDEEEEGEEEEKDTVESDWDEFEVSDSE